DTKASNKDLFQRIVVAGRMGGADGKPVIAVKSGVPWDAAKLAAAFDNPTKTSVGGKTVYYRKPGAASNGPGAVSVPNKNVAVLTDLLDTQLEPVLKTKGVALTGDLATLVNKGSGTALYVVAVLDGNTREQMKG